MNTKMKTPNPLASISKFILRALVLLLAGFSQITVAQAKSFPSAGQAVQALYDAVKNDDEGAVSAILGTGPELTSSGDGGIDKLEREKFAKKFEEMHRLVREPDGNVILYIGAENWPFPVPLVDRNGKWAFDADAGAQEVAARTIGEDESIALQVCQQLGKAAQPVSEQMVGGPALEFAQKLALDPAGTHQPFHGYNFRIGSEQSLGVVLVAYPADYRVSGVMTFIVLPGGSVFEKDLGTETASLAPKINGKPNGDWAPVQ